MHVQPDEPRDAANALFGAEVVPFECNQSMATVKGNRGISLSPYPPKRTQKANKNRKKLNLWDRKAAMPLSGAPIHHDLPKLLPRLKAKKPLLGLLNRIHMVNHR